MHVLDSIRTYFWETTIIIERCSIINMSVFLINLHAFPKYNLYVMWQKLKKNGIHVVWTVSWTGDFIDNTDEDGHIFSSFALSPVFLASMFKSWHEFSFSGLTYICTVCTYNKCSTAKWIWTQTLFSNTNVFLILDL